jgi:hypothetical protein
VALGANRRPADIAALAAFTWWRELAASLDDETLNAPLGEAAGYFAGASVRS